MPWDDVQLHEVSVTSDPPHPDWKVQAPGGGSVVPDAVVPAVEQRIRGDLPPAAGVALANGESATIITTMHFPAEGKPEIVGAPVVVNDPAGAVEALARLRDPREFHPAPKPVRKARPKR